MTKAICEKFLGEGADGTAYLMRRGPDYWVRKTYSVWPPPGGANLKILDPYLAELQAYRRIASCPNLYGWVPEYLGSQDRSIHIGFVDGERLDQTFKNLTVEELRTLWGQLKGTVKMLHSVGVAHGDCRRHNIMVDRTISPPEAILFDFSRAKFEHHTKNWGCAMEDDIGSLRAEFNEMIRMRYSEMAMKSLQKKQVDGEYSAQELAMHLRRSYPWPELLDTLTADESLHPLCILGMAQNLYESRRRDDAFDFIKLHLPRVMVQQMHEQEPINQPTVVMLQAYEAMASGDPWCLHYLPAAIELCQEKLGYYDPFTLKARIDLALRNFRTGQAHPLLVTLLHDLNDHGLRLIPEPERHLLTDAWSHEYLINLVRKSLAIAERYCLQSQEELAVTFGQEECTASCSHHTDFTASTTILGLPLGAIPSDESTESPALSFSHDTNDGHTDSGPATPAGSIVMEDQIDVDTLNLHIEEVPIPSTGLAVDGAEGQASSHKVQQPS